MDTDERLLSYCGRLAVNLGGTPFINISRDNKKLTPAMRRRLRHKENSRKTHSHAGLPEVHLPDSDYTRRVPCGKCHSLATKQMVRIGGSPFRMGGGR